METAERRFLRLIGCFSGGIRSGFRFGTLGVTVFSGSAGKNRKPPSTTLFSATKPQVAEVYNRGLVGRSWFYPALLESPHESMRHYRNPRAHRTFSCKETAGRGEAASRCARQVLNLPHTSDYWRFQSGFLMAYIGFGCISFP